MDSPSTCLNIWPLKRNMVWEQVLSMFLNTVFVIFDSVNIDEFSFEYTSSATMFIVSPNGTHVYRLFISKVLQTSTFCGFMLLKYCLTFVL